MAQSTDLCPHRAARRRGRAGARPGNRALARFFRHRLAMIGLIIIVLLVLASVVGPYLLPFDDLYIDIRNRFAAPFSGPHFFGTDQLGRDLLARLLMAGRISLTIGFSAMVISTLIGTIVGVVAGFYGRALGAVLMRFVDAMLCFPTIFLLLTLAAFIQPDVVTLTIIIAATSWMEVARVVEAQIRALRERDLRRRRRAARRLRPLHHVPRADPQRGGAHRRRRDAQRGARHPDRGLCQLPRLRHPAADRELGQHAEQRAAISRARRHGSRSFPAS